MPQGNTESSQDQAAEPANANQLVAKIKAALIEAGVKFEGDFAVTDVLAAALDCVEAGRTQAESVMRGRVYGTVRGAVIANAEREYTSDDGLRLLRCDQYVDGALRERGLALLTDTEKQELPVERSAFAR